MRLHTASKVSITVKSERKKTAYIIAKFKKININALLASLSKLTASTEVENKHTIWVNYMPESDTQHVRRIPHAHKARLPHKLEISIEEVKLPVN